MQKLCDIIQNMIKYVRNGDTMAENKSIAQYGKLKEFATNEFVFFEGSTGEEMYIVLQGKFGVFLNSMSDFPLKVSEINPGSFFGEMSLIDNQPRSASIISEDNSKTLCINKKDFLPFLAENTHITTSILQTLVSRYKATYTKLKEQGKSIEELEKYQSLNDEMIVKLIEYGPQKAYEFMHNLSKILRLTNEKLLQDGSNKVNVQTTQLSTEDEPSLLKEKISLLPKNYSYFDKVVPSMYTRNVYKKPTKCWVCDHEYIVESPNYSKIIPSKNDYDFRQHHQNFDLLWYSTSVCPNCNFATLLTANKNTDPDIYKNIKSKSFDENVEKVGELPSNRTIDHVIKSYYLAKLCNQITENNALVDAKIMIRLYWLYKDLGAEELKLEAANEALEYYSKYISTTPDITDLNLVQINIMMAEIYVEIGEYFKARSLYHKNLTLGEKVHATLYAQSQFRFRELKTLQESMVKYE